MPRPNDPGAIGCHASICGGLASGGLKYAAEVAAEVIQVFVSGPRGWTVTPAGPDQDARLRESGIPVFIHVPYLINVGSADATRDIAMLKELRETSPSPP
jgi:deoxyribonuclease-4